MPPLPLHLITVEHRLSYPLPPPKEHTQTAFTHTHSQTNPHTQECGYYPKECVLTRAHTHTHTHTNIYPHLPPPHPDSFIYLYCRLFLLTKFAKASLPEGCTPIIFIKSFIYTPIVNASEYPCTTSPALRPTKCNPNTRPVDLCTINFAREAALTTVLCPKIELAISLASVSSGVNSFTNTSTSSSSCVCIASSSDKPTYAYSSGVNTHVGTCFQFILLSVSVEPNQRLAIACPDMIAVGVNCGLLLTTSPTAPIL
eukprot:GHVR01016856.1.p1 GENE.GHVR01016856.1~~GHVR01016856.1.p1  ORF type:complete len:256 (+),score=87.66 GHVR01016856.1:333-1100(+)